MLKLSDKTIKDYLTQCIIQNDVNISIKFLFLNIVELAGCIDKLSISTYMRCIQFVNTHGSTISKNENSISQYNDVKRRNFLLYINWY